MSAFLVSKEDIDLLVSGMREHDTAVRIDGQFHRANKLDPTTLGKILWQENVESLAARYGARERDDNAAEIAAYRFKSYGPVKPGALAQLASCYAYQTCEHEGWRASDAFFAICGLEHALCKLLPGAGDAPWGISDKTDIAKCLA